MKSKYDDCTIGLDPGECTVKAGCRYWSRELQSCGYRAAKEAERLQRQHVEEDERSDVMKRIRITPR